MNINTTLVLLLIVSFALLPSISSARDIPERGKYIYDETGYLTRESYLGLSDYLWKLDVKSGYETVLVFPKEKMTVEQMGEWFNDHGVGKEKKDNGLAIFVFQDNTVYGMIGDGHDIIAVPYLSTFGGRALKGLDKEPVLSILNLVTTIGKKIDEPTLYKQAYNTRKGMTDNLNIIVGWLLICSLIILLYQQKDGFQASDLIIPGIFFVFMIIIVGIIGFGSEYSSNIGREYGVINSTKIDQYTYTEMKCTGSGKSRTCWPVEHTDYINDVTIISYDLVHYTYRFSSKDSKYAWQQKENDLLELSVNIQNHGLYGVGQINDNSGGKTSNYGTWIKTDNTSSSSIAPFVK